MDIKWIEAEDVTDETAESILSDVSGILVPGGFGDRGIEGKVAAAKYARTHKIPYFGICLGMQIAVIEFARNVLGITDANSGEFAEDCPHKVIDFTPDQYGDIPEGRHADGWAHIRARSQREPFWSGRMERLSLRNATDTGMNSTTSIAEKMEEAGNLK